MNNSIPLIAKLLNRDRIEVEKQWRRAKKYSDKDYLKALQLLVDALKYECQIPQIGSQVEVEGQLMIVESACPNWCCLSTEDEAFKVPLWLLLGFGLPKFYPPTETRPDR